MFPKTKKVDSTAMGGSATASKKGVPSVISSDLHILGNMVSEGLVDVDGSIEGNIKAEQVTVRANGKIKGDVVAQAVHIYGQVHGLIRAHTVHLYSSCHIEGVVIHESLSVEDGAFIDGKFKHTHNKAMGEQEERHHGDEGDEGFLETQPVSVPGSLRLIG